MREIKLRAWDGKRMTGLGLSYGFEGAHNDIATIRVIDEGSVLMQYTGLKDKNGVEIYEGDIITAGSYPVEVSYSGYQYAGKHCDSMVELEVLRNPQHIEVIGNIYENPELLK